MPTPRFAGLLIFACRKMCLVFVNMQRGNSPISVPAFSEAKLTAVAETVIQTAIHLKARECQAAALCPLLSAVAS